MSGPRPSSPLILTYAGREATARTEREARGIARAWKGVDRVYETPAEDGWDLWGSLADPDDRETPVRVRVR